MNKVSNYTIPDVFAPKSVKDTDKFATNVAKYVLGSTQDYRSMMASKYKKNRDIFSGNQSLQDLKDLLQVEDNETFFNVKFTPRPIIKKIIRLIVSGYLKDEEAVNVTALSKHIADRKNRNKLKARFRMENKELISDLEEMAAVPLVGPDEFTPDSEEELELYADMNDKETEETLMQDTLTYILNCNDMESLKNLCIRELCINNLFGLYETVTESGRPKLEPIYAEDAIVPLSFHDDFRGGSFFGRFVRMNIADIRSKFKIPAHKEKEFYNQINDLNKGSLVKTYGTYDSGWSFSNSRPYDKDVIVVLHLWWKCAKVKEHATGVKDGKPFFDYWDYPGYTPFDKVTGVQNLSVDYKTLPTAYEGYFLGGGDFVLDWGEQKNIPYDEQEEEVRSPFIYHMPENTGSMDVDSLTTMIRDSVEGMDLAILKIKMLIAKLAPDGVAVDVDSIMDMDLGTGGVLNPLTIGAIHKQTGDIYYRGRDDDGNETRPPVTNITSNFTDKLSGLISLYNFELENVRNYLGINEFRDGTANKSRTAAAFAQSQLDQSNMATEFIFRGWTKIMNYATKNSGLRLWYNLKFGSPGKGLLRFLGKANSEFIKYQKDIIATAYNFEYTVVMTKEERAQLEQTMQTALTEGSITTEDIIKIRQIKSAQVAHKYLTLLSKKRRKERMEEARENQKSAADYAAQSGEAVERAKQDTVKMAAELEMAKEKKRGENQVEAEMTKGALSIILQYAQQGLDVPDQYKPLVDFTMQSATAKLAKSSRIVDKEMQQLDYEEQMQQAEAELDEAVNRGEITEEERQAALEG